MTPSGRAELPVPGSALLVALGGFAPRPAANLGLRGLDRASAGRERHSDADQATRFPKRSSTRPHVHRALSQP